MKGTTNAECGLHTKRITIPMEYKLTGSGSNKTITFIIPSEYTSLMDELYSIQYDLRIVWGKIQLKYKNGTANRNLKYNLLGNVYWLRTSPSDPSIFVANQTYLAQNVSYSLNPSQSFRKTDGVWSWPTSYIVNSPSELELELEYAYIPVTGGGGTN